MGGNRHRWVALILLLGAGILAGALVGGEGVLAAIAAAGIPILLGLAVLTGAQRITTRTAITVGLALGIALVVGRLWTVEVTGDLEAAEVGAQVFRSITLLGGAAFIGLGPVRGLVLSGITWSASIIVMVVGPVPVAITDVHGTGVVGVAVSGAAVILMFRLLSDSAVQARAQAEVARSSAELAFLDELTGLPNRRQMTLHLQGAISRALEGAEPDTLVMFDLDRFKAINDTLGHDAGDEVLRRTAGVATAALRDGDVLGRWGGEEFLILLHDADDDVGRAVAERCRHALEVVQGPAAVTASFGVTTVHPADTVTDVLRRADLALYEAKQGGRNRIVVRRAGRYGPEPDTSGAVVGGGEGSGGAGEGGGVAPSDGSPPR